MFGQIASIAIGGAHEGREKPVERDRVGPADFDLEDLDAGALGRRHPHDVLCRRDQTRAQALGVAAQAFQLRNTEGVVIGKCACADENGAEGSQCRKEFLRTADPGEGQKGGAS